MYFSLLAFYPVPHVVQGYLQLYAPAAGSSVNSPKIRKNLLDTILSSFIQLTTFSCKENYGRIFF
jgi:hypothetical protein